MLLFMHLFTPFTYSICVVLFDLFFFGPVLSDFVVVVVVVVVV